MRFVPFIGMIVALFVSIPCVATEYHEYLAGGLTYHVFNPNGVADHFEHKVDSTGQLISNPMIGFRRVTITGVEYTSVVYFGGENSIGEAMAGAAYSSGFIVDSWRLGLIAGVYFQDNDKFLDRGIQPIYLIPHPGIGPTPVLGAEVTKTWNVDHDVYILFNSLLSPIILNATVGIGWRL